MHDSDIHSVARYDDKIDQAILGLLIDDRCSPQWAIEELVREIGDRVAVEDSLRRLYGAGLIHRLGEGFVFPTRAAVRAHQLTA